MKKFGIEIFIIVLTVIIAFMIRCSPIVDPRVSEILNNACVIWSQNNNNVSAKIIGNVTMGIKLTGTDRKASRINGGTGTFTNFNGGYVNIGQGTSDALNFEGYGFTLHIRLKITDGNWDKPIISKGGGDDALAWELCGRPFGFDPEQKNWEMSMQNYFSYGNSEGKGYALEFVLGVQPQPFLTKDRKNVGEKRHNTFRVGVPVSMIGVNNWHNVTIRFTGPKLEMYVDGVLVDEEWPIGKLRKTSSPCLIGALDNGNGITAGFTGCVEFIAIWNKALSEKEIITINGGEKNIAKAELMILGKEQSTMQYWRPRGHNIWTGDVVPAYNNGQFHLFYLYDRRHHGSKWGAGAHQFAHYSSTDLVHWEKHPMALEITRQWETFGTGCPIFVGNRLELHYGLHTTRFFDDSLTTDPLITEGLKKNSKYFPIPTEDIDDQWLEKNVPIGHAVAVSEDRINFKKLKMVFTPAQNMCVFKSAQKDLFCLLYDNHLLTSQDLRVWTPINESFLPTGPQTSANNTSECPNYFEWNGWHYILMGGSGFWMSKEELENYWEGPFNTNGNVIHPRWDIYDGLFVPMVAAFNDNRRLLAGWTFSPSPHGSWGGYLVFRELIQYSDGTLGMKWPKEMIPPTGDPLKWKVKDKDNGVTLNNNDIIIKTNEIAGAYINGLPLSYRITADVLPGTIVKSIGIQFKKSVNENDGCELQFIPGKGQAQFNEFKQDSIARLISYTNDRNSTYHPMGGYNFAIDHIESLDQPFKLDIIVKYDSKSNIVLIDACIDERRTMITHRYNLKCKTIRLFANKGEAKFKNIVISPLI